MNSLLAALILSTCSQVGIPDTGCPTLLTPDSVRAIAQHAVGKTSGKSYIIVNTSEFDKLDDEMQVRVLVHELSHHTHYEKTGRKSTRHPRSWQIGCQELANASGVEATACGSSFVPQR